MLPSQVEIVSSLPMNTNGKVLKSALRQQALQNLSLEPAMIG
jgi:acyl-CoA synthetase (AMP-forming)/AMP-acid ligase II